MTQRTANTHLLARDGSPGQPGFGHLAPVGGALPAPGSRVPGPWSSGALLSPSLLPLAPGCFACHALRHSRPWRLTILVPQGLGFGASLLTASAVSSALGSQRIFCPSFWCSALPFCITSRGDELRQLAAQLSVLAALEDSIALGLSRVMCPAGSGRSAAPPTAGSPSAPAATAAPSVATSPSHEVAASLLRSATLTSACNRARTRSRSPAPLPKRAPCRRLGVSRGDGTGHGLGHQVLPASPSSPAAPLSRFSRSPRCFGRLAATCRRLWTFCTLSPGLRGPLCCGDRVQLR